MILTRNKIKLSEGFNCSKNFRNKFNLWSRGVFGVHKQFIDSRNIDYIFKASK